MKVMQFCRPDPKRVIPSAPDSDRPKLANYVSLQSASGMLCDFELLEPAVIAVLPNLSRRVGKLAESLNGRLEMGYESAMQLQNQLTWLLAQLMRAGESEKPDGGVGKTRSGQWMGMASRDRMDGHERDFSMGDIRICNCMHGRCSWESALRRQTTGIGSSLYALAIHSSGERHD